MKTKTIAYVGAAVAGLAIAVWLLRKASSAADAAKRAASAALSAVNPADPNNLASRAANAITQAATGTPNSFGTWLAETFDSTTRAAADAAMRDMNKPTATIPSLDLGEYAETVDRDDRDIMGTFGAPPLTIEIIGSAKDTQ